jgi:NitT/TauT family transport system substrate-binding protein
MPGARFMVKLDQALLVNLESQARWAIRTGLGAGSGAPDFLQHVAPADLEAVKPSAVSVRR